jgi:hypothetical protein
MQASVQIEKVIYIEEYRNTTIPVLKRITRQKTTSLCIDPFEKNECVKMVKEIEKRAHKHIKR